MNFICFLVSILTILGIIAANEINYINNTLVKSLFTHYYPPRFYTKHQSPPKHAVTLPGVFMQIPGLVLLFSHQMPMLYEITFHAHCSIHNPSQHLFLRIRVDNHLIVADQLVGQMQWLNGVDGAYISSNDQRQGGNFQCSKSDVVYLAAGPHVIDVVATASGGANVDEGFLRVKLSQFDEGTDINMPLLSPPKLTA